MPSAAECSVSCLWSAPHTPPVRDTQTQRDAESARCSASSYSQHILWLWRNSAVHNKEAAEAENIRHHFLKMTENTPSSSRRGQGENTRLKKRPYCDITKDLQRSIQQQNLLFSKPPGGSRWRWPGHRAGGIHSDRHHHHCTHSHCTTCSHSA